MAINSVCVAPTGVRRGRSTGDLQTWTLASVLGSLDVCALFHRRMKLFSSPPSADNQTQPMPPVTTTTTRRRGTKNGEGWKEGKGRKEHPSTFTSHEVLTKQTAPRLSDNLSSQMVSSRTCSQSIRRSRAGNSAQHGLWMYPETRYQMPHPLISAFLGTNHSHQGRLGCNLTSMLVL